MKLKKSLCSGRKAPLKETSKRREKKPTGRGATSWSFYLILEHLKDKNKTKEEEESLKTAKPANHLSDSEQLPLKDHFDDTFPPR